MSDLDQAIAAFALGDEDDLCEWYRRPDIGEQASSGIQAGRGVLSEFGLCEDCAALTQAMLSSRRGFSTGHCESMPAVLDEEYRPMFRKLYSQLRADAGFCAFCRAVEDSVAITQRYATGHHPDQIPPGSHVWLQPVYPENGDLPPGSHVWPQPAYPENGDPIGFRVEVTEDVTTSETDSETGSSETSSSETSSSETNSSEISSSHTSGGRPKSMSTLKGFLEVEFRETEPVRVVDNISSSAAITGRESITIQGSSSRKAVPYQDMKEMLHSWLRECDSVHSPCRDHKNAVQSSTDVDTSACPSRLLEIQQVDRRLHIRLVAGNEGRTRYVALSHRWGDYRSIRTTKLNFENYRNGINFDSLSLTLQQAVQITYAVGVRHLWVDCLCIIQDDDNDWALEAPKMGSIYASAYFTIAASALEHEGCFPIKFPEDHRVTIDVHPGLELNIYPRSYDFTIWSIQHEPLQKRGWTLQERLLSQRILHCSRYEYYWLCRGQRRRAWGNPGKWKGYGSALTGGVPLLLSYSAQSQRAALREWYLLLFDYSNRQLTLEKDKLIAINGLVDIFQRWIGSRYLHGLWECDLACGLVWHPGTNSFHNDFSEWGQVGRSMSTKHKNPRFWRTWPTRAPSWSWASVDGFQEHYGPDLHDIAEFLGQPVSMLVRVKATVASDDEHRSCLGGESSAGPWVLKISGRLSKALYGYENADEQSNRVWQIDREGRPQTFGFVADDPNFDTHEHSTDAESSRLYVLPIVAYMGLVITPAGDDDDVPLYRRVGTCDFMTSRDECLSRETSEGSTAGTTNGDTEHATVQADDRVIEVLGSTNKTDTEAFDEDAGATLYTEGESGSTEPSVKSAGTSDDAAGPDIPWEDYIAVYGWLGEAGASETIFLC